MKIDMNLRLVPRSSIDCSSVYMYIFAPCLLEHYVRNKRNASPKIQVFAQREMSSVKSYHCNYLVWLNRIKLTQLSHLAQLDQMTQLPHFAQPALFTQLSLLGQTAQPASNRLKSLPERIIWKVTCQEYF